MQPPTIPVTTDFHLPPPLLLQGEEDGAWPVLVSPGSRLQGAGVTLIHVTPGSR